MELELQKYECGSEDYLIYTVTETGMNSVQGKPVSCAA